MLLSRIVGLPTTYTNKYFHNFPKLFSINNMLSNQLKFDNRILRSLPIDENSRSYPRIVPNAIYSYSRPQFVKNPVMVAYSPSALKLLGFECNDIDALTIEEENELAEFLSGNKLPDNVSPYAHCYCGYQFGIFAGQLGDGAAISLGEVLVSSKSTSTSISTSSTVIDTKTNTAAHDLQLRYELQIKGAGITPYSRK